MNFKRLFFRENLLVFLFCMAVMLGPAAEALFSFDPTTIGNTDTRSYIGLARFELNQNPKRKYRVIVPAMAAAVNSGSFAWIKLAPKSFKGDFGLAFSFFVVNLVLMSLFGLLIYKYLRCFELGISISLFGALVMLTCRYTAICAGTPLAESLYFIVVAMTLLGIRTKNTSMLIAAIFIGPFAKEAFLFIAPLILFFAHIPRLKQVGYFLLSGILVFGFRYLFDRYAGLPPVAGLKADIGHVYQVVDHLRKIFSGRGIYEIFSVTGFWIVFILIGSGMPSFREKLRMNIDKLHVWFLVSVFVQLLLSGIVERMVYLAMPVFCLITALAFEETWKKLSVYRSTL